jgi:hypothetical protein
MNDWYSFNRGQSFGQKGSEKGVILRDDEHAEGARITLERTGRKRFAITCGIYGWMVHTRFFKSEAEAVQGFEEMKEVLATILNLIPNTDDDDRTKIEKVEDSILRFIEIFP